MTISSFHHFIISFYYFIISLFHYYYNYRSNSQVMVILSQLAVKIETCIYIADRKDKDKDKNTCRNTYRNHHMLDRVSAKVMVVH